MTGNEEDIEKVDWNDDKAVKELMCNLDEADEQRLVRLTSATALQGAAEWYASKNIPIFPCVPQGKTPATRHGFKDASTDIQQIKAWWRSNPRYNIGMPTGILWDVVDVDGSAGYLSLGKIQHANCPADCSTEWFCDAPLPFDMSGRTITPRGGMHFFIPPDLKGGNLAEWTDGLDYRGLGGYVLLPPSVGSNGKLYQWMKMVEEIRISAT